MHIHFHCSIDRSLENYLTDVWKSTRARLALKRNITSLRAPSCILDKSLWVFSSLLSASGGGNIPDLRSWFSAKPLEMERTEEMPQHDSSLSKWWLWIYTEIRLSTQMCHCSWFTRGKVRFPVFQKTDVKRFRQEAQELSCTPISSCKITF